MVSGSRIDIANYTPKDHRETDAYVDIENETQKYEKSVERFAIL